MPLFLYTGLMSGASTSGRTLRNRGAAMFSRQRDPRFRALESLKVWRATLG